MTHIIVKVTGAKADANKTGPLTRGMVGVPVTFEFNKDWDGLTITAVFKAGSRTVDRTNITDSTTIPWELTAVENDLYIGLFGVNGEGTLVIPTVWAYIGNILPGADPSGDVSVDPSLPVWQDILNRVNELDKNGGPGGYYTPEVSQLDSNTVRITYQSSAEGMPTVEPQDITLPAGKDYVLTESDKAEIAAQAAELVEVPTEEQINGLIHTALGVVENGTY